MSLESNQQLADLGVRQFVRNVTIEVFQRNVGKGKETKDVLIEINIELMNRLRKIAQSEFNQLVIEMTELLDKEEENDSNKRP